MKKLHEDKLRILRAMQGVRLSDSTTPQPKEDSPPSKGIIFNTIELGTALIRNYYTKSWHVLYTVMSAGFNASALFFWLF